MGQNRGQRRARPGSSSDPGREATPERLDRDARFRQTFEDAPIGIAHVTPDGQWLEANPFLFDFLGYTRDELLGLRFPDFTHPDDVAFDVIQRRRLLAGEITRHRMDKRYIRKDGTVVWGLLTMSAARDAEGRIDHLIATVEDIGERKHMEAQIHELASLLREAEVSAHVGAWAWDVPTDEMVWTDEVFRLYGVVPVPCRLTIEAFLRPVHPDDRERLRSAMEKAWIDRSIVSVEYRVLWEDGSVRTLHCRARVATEEHGLGTRMLGSLQDITEHKRAAARLEESEQRYRSLFDNHADAVFSLDLNGIVDSANPACEAVSGYRPEELVGRHFASLVVPEHLDRAVAHFHLAVAGLAQSFELAIHHKSGKRVEIGLTSIPCVVRGVVAGVFGVARDLTARHSLEGQLRQAQKMEAVGRLAGGIAHDFNNLLTAILSHSELILGELRDERVRGDVDVIRQTATRAADLTRQLLAFSRQQVAQPRLTDLNTTIAETEHLLRHSVGEAVTLEADLAPVASVLASPGALEQVLVNLVVNARDAMPNGGRIRLRTRDAEVDDELASAHPGLKPGHYVSLAVEDTGLGISPDVQARMFEPFFTTKPVGEGTGLGLSTVYGIVKQYGGYVAVRSTPGEGSTFTVYLPRHGGAPEREEAKRHEPRPPTGTETVLVVEDEPTVRQSIRRILARHGYDVLEARHGADALRVLDEATTRIDLVLTDLVMPEMGGRELIAELKARRAASRILVISGYDAQAAMRGEALPPGTHFLEKPFTVDGLLQAVRAVLDAGNEELAD